MCEYQWKKDVVEWVWWEKYGRERDRKRNKTKKDIKGWIVTERDTQVRKFFVQYSFSK